MLIIIDKRIPEKAKDNLAKYGELIEFETRRITYETISGHPDNFFCISDNNLFTAPNLPDEYKILFKKNNITFYTGNKPVGQKYPESAHYNAVITHDFLIHRLDITEPAILENSLNLEKINVSQGYTRCSLLPLKNKIFITSDMGIMKTLSNRGFKVLFVSPESILIGQETMGFFGGSCGVFEDKVFIIGSLDFINDGGNVMYLIKKAGYEIVELYKGPLFDGGSIIFL